MNLCPTCRKLLYRTDACKGADGVVCQRTDGGSKSTAARTDALGTEGKERVSRSPDRTPRKLKVAPLAADQAEPGVGMAAPPVDIEKPAFDKKAWMRDYMREHRKGLRRRNPEDKPK